MKKTLLLVTALLTLVITGCKSDIDKMIDKMTLEEKARLLVGTGNEGRWVAESAYGDMKDIVPGAAGTTCPIERLGIPFAILSDGPAGVNIDSTREGDSQTFYCTHFPIGTLLSSTWNNDLVESVGDAIGQEALAYGVDVVLGPGMNIHRFPLNGRNFEYYSEDPVLTGLTAAAYINGVQKNGVAACPKHFAANNQETNRMGNDVKVSQRALREIYLRGFEIMVRNSHPKTLMTSYNKINGISVSERHDIVTEMLRDEWGFDGMVMTDWYGGDHPEEQMKAGNDLLMPGQQWQIDSIVNAVRAGRLDEKVVDQSVRRVLKMIYEAPRNQKGHTYDNNPDLKSHAQAARQVATEGMVLLKNDGQTLPLNKEIHNVALFGCASYDFIAGGTGSGDVNRAYTISMLQGLENAGYAIDPLLADRYNTFIPTSKQANSDAAVAEFGKRYPDLCRIRPSEMPLSAKEIDAQLKRSDIAIITLGRTSGEYYDRPSREFNLSDAELTMLENVCATFHAAGKKVVVVLNISGVIETASWKHLPDAILCAWLPGQEGGNSVADILSGKANPSGRLSMTFPIKLTDDGAYSNFPVDLKSDNVSVAARREDKGDKNIDFTNYDEGVYVGYRWYDTRTVEVSYPFGYGLSYTTFELSDMQVSKKGNQIVVNVKVKNTGKTEGKEVVQLYVTAPGASMDKPAKELKAYAKTRSLKPGEVVRVDLLIAKSDLASFDEGANKWVVEPGTYKMQIATSSRDIKASKEIEL